MRKLTLPKLLSPTAFTAITSLTAIASLTAITSFAQKQFVIHGKVTLISTSKNIHLSGYDPVPIQPDGSFELKGEVSSPSMALIYTDSSGAWSIWLEPGEYTVECKEITLPDYKPVLIRTPVVKGPADAELYNDFENRQSTGFGVPSHKNEDPAITTERKQRVIRYMDSVLKITTSSPALPEMVRFAQYYVGDELTKEYIQRLEPELRTSNDITMIEDGFKRKEKVAREKIFENFTLRDTTGRNFTLATLTGKKAILIDLWASDCGACRLNHPKLVEWYKKYADKGLQIVSVSIDQDKAAWLKAIHQDGIGNWINVCDTGSWKAALMQDYYIMFIPFSFLLDGNRKIMVVNNMADSWIQEKDIAAMLDASPRSAPN